MSEKDPGIMPSSSSLGIPCGVTSRVDITQGMAVKDVDAKNLEKSASSPDSAIDLTEDNKHLTEMSVNTILDIVMVNDLIDDILYDVCAISKRRERNRKREKFSEKDKWNLIKQCGTIGWKRILARNCDDEGGWGFNFVSPTGLKLTVKELEKFLKKKDLDIDDLIFEANIVEKTSFPRKKAKIKMGYPIYKIRDLKLPKKLEVERKRKIAQAKLANKPTFKSISEFLASLDRCDSQNSSCSDDASRNTEYSDEDYEESDTSFSINESSEIDVNFLCKEMIDECMADAVSRVCKPVKQTDDKIRSLERSIEEVQLRLSSMLQNSRSPKPIEKLKIKFGDKSTLDKDIMTHEKSLSGIEKLKAFRMKKHKVNSESINKNSCEIINTPEKKIDKLKIKIGDKGSTTKESTIEKIKITPERLKNSGFNHKLTSEMNSPTTLKIKLPKDTPERIKLTIKTKKTPDICSSKKKKKRSKERRNSENKELTHLKIKPILLPGCQEDSELPIATTNRPKKYSIFKTRNDGKASRENSPVNFTDKNTRKSLNMRSIKTELGSTSHGNTPVIIPIIKVNKDGNAEKKKEKWLENPSVNLIEKNSILKIEIDDDLDDQNIDDEFTQEVQLESPHSKVTVVQQSLSSTPPVRRNIFGPHSPMCKDEISPEKSESPKHLPPISPPLEANEICDRVVKPASRTHGRVLSNEDAMMAIDAVVSPTKMVSMYDEDADSNVPLLKRSQIKPSHDPSVMSSPIMDRSRLSTPSLPAPAPTPTPSLPILSPQDCNDDFSHSNMTTPSLPSLSPAVNRGTPIPINHYNSSNMSSPSPAPAKLPEQNAIKLPKRPEGILPRRLQTMKMMQMDPSKSTPLSVEIPGNHVSNHNSYSPSQSDQSSLESAEPTPNYTAPKTIQEDQFKESPKHVMTEAKLKVEASPVEVSQTGRRMRDCRKFIHYEFSPPFASSDSSVSEVDSVEIIGENNPVKKLTKKRGRPRKNPSTEECLSSPSSYSSKSSQNPEKRGKPVKSKSTESKEEVFTFDEESNGSDICTIENDIAKKKKRGRPSKKRLSQHEEPKLSISEMAEQMIENQISPITRKKIVLPKLSAENEAKTKMIISLQRESLLLRRNSEDTQQSSQPSKVERSKSIDSQINSKGNTDDKYEGLEELKKKLRQIPLNQLILKNLTQKQDDTSDPTEASTESNINTNIEALHDQLYHESEESDDSIQSGSAQSSKRQFGYPYDTETRQVKTLVIRKRVRVQEYADPLLTIRDQLPKNSPPPQMIEDEERPVTPPPGTCTIYEENLDLVDGMRVLTKIGCHFYPGRVKAIDSPYIFAVSVDGERGNKPHIYAAEELLEKTILEVKPLSRRYTPVATRVCVLWSSKLSFLYPATVTAFSSADQFIIVNLDDGDEREVHMENVRLLPKGYPKVISKCNESPIGLVEASTMSRLPVSAIHIDKSPISSKSSPEVYDFDDNDNSKLKLKSSSHVKFKHGKYGTVGNKLVAKSKILAESKFKRERKKTEYQKKLFEQRTSKKCADGDIDYDIESHEKLKTETKPKMEVKDASLSQDMLKDGLRLLTKIDGHFYPGRLNAIRPPDIYGVLLDNERGFRPIIYAREELLNDAIKELKLKSAEVPMGTRICAYWSAKYHYLHPGTIIPVNEDVDKFPGKYLNVVLDDGDSREIHIDQMRLLPFDYPKVAYKEDTPSPRKRSSSRPSSRAETPKSTTKSEHSRPNSSLSNPSDNEHAYRTEHVYRNLHKEIKKEPSPVHRNDSEQRVLDPPDFKDFGRKSPQSPMNRHNMKNSHTPPVSREGTPLASPIKSSSKVYNIPDPPAKPLTLDLVGLISKGIDKLVDKKVIGNRNIHSPFIRPLESLAPKLRPLGPLTPCVHNFQSGQRSPSPQVSFPSRPSSSENSPAPTPPPNQETEAISAPPTGETGIKAKSRLSSLIQAMSGKIKKPDNSLLSPPSLPPPPPPPAHMNLKTEKHNAEEEHPPLKLANKWQLAFNINSIAAQKQLGKSKDKPHDERSNTSQFIGHFLAENDDAEDVEDGYLNSNNIVPGIKILLLKDSCFHPATIVSIDATKKYGIRLKSSKTHEVLYYSEQDLILNTVLEREAMSSDNLDKDMRVAAHLNNRMECLYTGTVVDRKEGDVILVSMDSGIGYEEVQIDCIRILPNSYPKIYMSETKAETPTSVVIKNEYNDLTSFIQQNETAPRLKHKHNILLGYDFVDENDSEVQAWDLAIHRKNKKSEKAKIQALALLESDIKQEPEQIFEINPDTDPSLKLHPNDDPSKDVSDVIQKLNDLDQIDLNEEQTQNAELNTNVAPVTSKISLEERMRISLLSDALKKHSPKKDILQKLPRSKSPGRAPEPIKKEKKRKDSKDSIVKRLSMEDTDSQPKADTLQNTIDDITSELLSICKESNIDTPPRQQQTQSDQVETASENTRQLADSTDEPVKGILTVEELIATVPTGQELTESQTSAEETTSEEHDLLTFYSTKNIDQARLENKDQQIGKEDQVSVENMVEPSNTDISVKDTIDLDEHKQIEQANEKEQYTHKNYKELECKKVKYSSDQAIKDDSQKEEESVLMPSTISQEDDNKNIPTSNLDKPNNLNNMDIKESQDEITVKLISVISEEDSNKIKYEDSIKEIETEEIEKFNSGIIPELMTSDLKIKQATDEKVVKDLCELSFSFELSGDESVSIELTPTKEDNIKDILDEKTCKLTKKKTQKNANKSESPVAIESKEGTSLNDNISEDVTRKTCEKEKINNILEISFDKNESDYISDYKSNDKEITDESLNTSGFDISSIINRLEDEDEEDMSSSEALNKSHNNLTEEEGRQLSPKIKSLKKLNQEQKRGTEKKKNKKEIKSMKKTETEDKLHEEAPQKESKKSKKENQKVENLKDSIVTEQDSITLPLKEDVAAKEDVKKENGRIIDNGFAYIDPNMPANWYVMVRKRTDGKPDSYFFTPCHTKLRSKSEIIKFVEGLLPSKPIKNKNPISEMPLRENLLKEDLDLTRDIDPKIFETNKVNDGNKPSEIKEASMKQEKQNSKSEENLGTHKVNNKEGTKKETDSTNSVKEVDGTHQNKVDHNDDTNKILSENIIGENESNVEAKNKKKNYKSSKLLSPSCTKTIENKEESYKEEISLIETKTLEAKNKIETIKNKKNKNNKLQSPITKSDEVQQKINKKNISQNETSEFKEKNKTENMKKKKKNSKLQSPSVARADETKEKEERNQKETNVIEEKSKTLNIKTNKNKHIKQPSPSTPKTDEDAKGKNKKEEKETHNKSDIDEASKKEINITEKEDNLLSKNHMSMSGEIKNKKASISKNGKNYKSDKLKTKIDKKKNLLKKKFPAGKFTKDENTKNDDKKTTENCKDDHVFKVPSLESFRSQKNKSTKLLSPPCTSTDENKEKTDEEDKSEKETDLIEDEEEKLEFNKYYEELPISKSDKEKLKASDIQGEEKSEFDKLFEQPIQTTTDFSHDIEKKTPKENKISENIFASKRRSKRISDGDEVLNDSGDDGNTSDSDGDKSVIDKEKAPISSDASDTEELDDRSKKSRKLVKTRKTNRAEESSDEELSPTRQSRQKSENKSLNKSKKKTSAESVISDNSSSPEITNKVSLKRKTRSQSLTSESESETEDDKQPTKKSPKPKVFNECENSQENKENSDKEKLGRNNKTSRFQSRNSGSENDSDEGNPQKRKTRQHKNKEESETKENGSDKENELLTSSEESNEGDTSSNTVERDSVEIEIRNTRKNSKKNDQIEDSVSKAGVQSEKKDETTTKILIGLKSECKEDNDSDKEEENGATRRTRSNIKSKEDVDEKATIESTATSKPVIKKDENDKESSNCKEVRTTRSKQVETVRDSENQQKTDEGSETPNAIEEKQKTRSENMDSNEERADTPTRLTRGKIMNAAIKEDLPEIGKRDLRKRSDSSDSKDSVTSPVQTNLNSTENTKKKSNKDVTTEEEDEEDTEIILSMPKALRSKILSENQSPLLSPRDDEADKKQSLKRSTRNSDQIKDEVTDRPKTPKSSKALELSKPEKRKLSEEIESLKGTKKVALSAGNSKSTASESANVIPVKKYNTQQEQSKKKLLGPKSQRKIAPAMDKSDDEDIEPTLSPKEAIKKKKLLGPKSRRRKQENLSDHEDQEEQDDKASNTTAKEENPTIANETGSVQIRTSCNLQSDQSNPNDESSNTEKCSPIFSPSLSIIQKKKPSKCDLKLVSLFRHEMCRAKCGHCEEMGKYTMHMVHFDMPQKIISMECQTCSWTTVRRMVITTRVVG